MRILSLISIFILWSGYLFGQDPAYSQFYANPLHLNPAFTGTSQLPRLVVNYRNQWPQKGTSYTTYSLSYDWLVGTSKSGLGIQAYFDREPNNIISTTSTMLSYSYHVQVGLETFMTLGLQGGLVHKQFDLNNLIFPSNIDQISGDISGTVPISISNEQKTYPDFAVGTVGQYRRFFWSAGVHHLTQPNESILDGDHKGKLPIKVTLNAGARTRKLHHGLLSREFTISPNILYQQQGSFKQLNLGMYMIEQSILFGGWFRNNLDIRPDAIIFLVGWANKTFQFGYSFDYTLSKLSNYTYGSHEISLTFFMGRKNEKILRDRLLIPMI
ncbi:MAG TPA: type IX secretion system membrane protein PorP/SprF [Draconibacterium sp.]|nr:type IX secretion system membrane protein PorP/SprF [Draconibacterium sp.]